MNRKSIIGIACGFVLTASIGTAALTPKSVTVEPAMRRRAVETVYATGTIEVDVRVALRAKIGGTVANDVAQEGDALAKGARILRLENKQIATALAGGRVELAAAKVSAGSTSPQLAALRAAGGMLQADLSVARSELARSNVLAQSNAIPRAELERERARVSQLSSQLMSNLQQQKALALELKTNAARLGENVESLAAQADDTEVRAPFEGTVLRRHVAPGEPVAPNQLLVEFGDARKLLAQLTVDEDEIAHVHDGAHVVLTVGASRDRVIHGIVQRVNPDADRSRRAFTVRVLLDDADGIAKSGMSVTANVIAREEPSALTVPAGAVRDGTVWIVSGGKLEKRRVKTGITDTSFVQITEGVSDGEIVVPSPQAWFEEGRRVSAKRAR